MLGIGLSAADPGTAATFQVWEDSFGAPGVPAEFPHGAGLVADLDFDADSAEGGGLLFGAAEIEIRPTGSVVFVSFGCQLHPCEDSFTPGDAASGGVVIVTDSDVREKHGVYDLGTLEFDAASGAGTVELLGCHYAGTDAQERSCDPFPLVTLPEPRRALGGVAGVGLLLGARRRRRAAAARAGS